MEEKIIKLLEKCSGKVGFYYKDIEYVLTSFAKKGLDQSTYTGQKEYVDLVQFEANKYYYY